MKIAIVGSREFKNRKLIEDILYREFWQADGYDDTIHTLISGGARGVDIFAENYIKELNTINKKRQFPIIIFKPDWDKYGKSAGFLRNKLIVDEADMILAFWDGTSKGTKHSINLAIKTKKPINIYVR